jgi:hypothetical protein
MSWIYTIVFSGLLFAGRGDMPAVSMPELEPAPVAGAAKGDETERFSQTYPLSANGRVRVENVNGSVTVEGWDRNEVKLEYVKTADTRERLDDVEIRIDARPDSFSVETDFGDWKSGERWRDSGRLVVEYRLMVPRAAVLDEVETVNGGVTVSNFTNTIKVSAVNGTVAASQIRGTAKLSTVNGEVKADLDRIEAGSRITLETVNGRVELTIPSDSSALVKADSLNGDIRNDFGLQVRKGKYVGRDMYGRIGSGDAHIKLSSVNGGLNVMRKNDGRPVSPSTNLLNQKSNDDEDWDAHAAKVEKEVAAAHKANKAIEKSVTDTHKALVKMAPEIAKATADSVRVGQADLAKLARERGLLDARAVDAVFYPSAPRIERKSGVFIVKGKPTVTVNARGCAVSVRGWDKNEVQYRVTQVADARRSSPVEMNETHTDNSVELTVTTPDTVVRGMPVTYDPSRVRIEIFVPQRSNVNISTDRSIRIDGVSGDVKLDGDDEAINVRDVDGRLTVANSDGHIRVIGFRGEVDAETSDGLISLEGNFQKLNARGSEGSIMLTLPDGTSADIEANCPDIVGDGIDLKRVSTNEHKSRYRVGRGGSLYQIETGGAITVRGARVITDSQ